MDVVTAPIFTARLVYGAGRTGSDCTYSLLLFWITLTLMQTQSSDEIARSHGNGPIQHQPCIGQHQKLKV